ncbi:Heat-inducible transcription repressor HrcA [hydrothermal vent metagenome]|uniref:Heat-inducible transcription repressor HrcA n=1 Tax=hydrothermal vent metagenome TaxID=652676 RepID=A0A3B0SCS2_9ZZZZ
MSPPRGPDILDLDQRSREIFREIVESYLAAGEPVGSRTLSETGESGLSPASIRNTMAALTASGLLAAPHMSAGRIPTHAGLRLFVDGLLQIGDLNKTQQADIHNRLADRPLEQALDEASKLLSGLAGGAGLVLAPVEDQALRHVEFVPLAPDEAMAVLVYETGAVENRLMQVPAGTTPSALNAAGNFLSLRLKGRTLDGTRSGILHEIRQQSHALDQAAKALIEDGLAHWTDPKAADRTLIVRGRSQLIEDVKTTESLERIRVLLDELEQKKELISLLDQAGKAPGVKIYIGSENPLFSLSGSSVVTAPYMDMHGKVMGAIGVIGPTRINYAKVIPLVDYTAQAIGYLMRQQGRN